MALPRLTMDMILAALVSLEPEKNPRRIPVGHHGNGRRRIVRVREVAQATPTKARAAVSVETTARKKADSDYYELIERVPTPDSVYPR